MHNIEGKPDKAKKYFFWIFVVEKFQICGEKFQIYCGKISDLWRTHILGLANFNRQKIEGGPDKARDRPRRMDSI